MSFQNLPEVFIATCERFGDAAAFSFHRDGRWQNMSWNQARRKVVFLAGLLEKRGIKSGDRVAILSATRVEWTLADLAILSVGAVTVPIYPSNTAEQIDYILKNSESKLLFVENSKQAEKARGMPVIPMEGESEDLGWDLKSEEDAYRERLKKIAPQDVATIVYTSGTTGHPKGVVLTHANFLAENEALQEVLPLSPSDVGLLFLPLAHIFARAFQFWQIFIGCRQAYSRGFEYFPEDLISVKPTYFAAVPRIYEKFSDKIRAAIERRPKFLRPFLAPLIKKKVRALFGGHLRFAISGGAPLSGDVASFFEKNGVLVIEGYGLTETTAGISMNREKNYRFGTVGLTASCVELRIAEDGEILVRSPMVFRGYYKNPEATVEVLSPEGWFHTGDVGVVDSDGFLKITDRKKDLIVTSAGKNIAPQNIEGLFKTIPWINQVLVHGDRRNYLTALVTLAPEAALDFAKSRGVACADLSQLARHPQIWAEIREKVGLAIEEKNRILASFETVKKFVILDEDFSQEKGELTPTLKLRRKFVGEKYKDVLDKLYSTP